MNRIDRLTGMILLLQGSRVITAEQVAAHFEISVRTVYRDIAALSEAGVPIQSEAGVGYSLMRGYHIPPVMFTEDEAAALFFSGEITEKLADESLRLALRSALLKVRSVLPRERHEYLNRLKNVVRVQLPALRAPDGEDAHDLLMPLQQAVVRRQQLCFHYDAGGRGEITTRTVDPLGILFYGKQWHLIAFCQLRQDFRDFRMDRVVDWEVLPTFYSGHEDFSLSDFLAEQIRTCELTPATVIFQKPVVERMRREWPQGHKTEIPLPDGRLKVEMLTWCPAWISHWLLSFGADMEVIHPQSLRDEIRKIAREIAGCHEPNPEFAEALLT